MGLTERRSWEEFSDEGRVAGGGLPCDGGRSGKGDGDGGFNSAHVQHVPQDYSGPRRKFIAAGVLAFLGLSMYLVDRIGCREADTLSSQQTSQAVQDYRD